jgi:hypothetical protein
MERISLENIPRREPIIDSESREKFSLDNIDQQWFLLTEIARQEILTNEDVREGVAAFVNLPVNEALPHDFLGVLVEKTDRARNLKNRYQESLGEYLALDTVPDEEIGSDIRKSETLHNPEERIAYFKSKDLTSEEFEKIIHKYIETGFFTKGLSPEEKIMIMQRYRFARDVKLLALASEMINQENIELENLGGFYVKTLPSGTEIITNVQDKEFQQQLLNPAHWEKRRQIKDRVYEIVIDGNNYILKEQKTNRHEHQISGGRPSLSSVEEFQIALEMSEKASYHKNGIKISYEKPLGAVTCPDGFQFSIFKHEENLDEHFSTNGVLQQEIAQRPEIYKEEFTEVRNLAKKLHHDPRMFDRSQPVSESGFKKFLTWLQGEKKQEEKNIPELSFEDFSRVKAFSLEEKALEVNKLVQVVKGFRQGDGGRNWAMRSIVEDNIPHVEIINFDFEYQERISPEEIQESLKIKQEIADLFFQDRGRLNFKKWEDGTSLTDVQRAGYLALLDMNSDEDFVI